MGERLHHRHGPEGDRLGPEGRLLVPRSWADAPDRSSKTDSASVGPATVEAVSRRRPLVAEARDHHAPPAVMAAARQMASNLQRTKHEAEDVLVAFVVDCRRTAWSTGCRVRG